MCELVRLAAAMNDRWFSTVSAGARVRVAIAPPPGRLLLLGELVTDLDAPAREPVRGVRPHARDRGRPSPVRRRHREVPALHRILVDSVADESVVEGKASTPRRESMVREG
ncbi:hypothetical protein OG205_02340 [Lentzea sp. NBC_00516]|uniref:hypothetical protein n=1 Tax=Lentzea sp. NBC_00516 TaxID=2903582 RepID=UPI002E80B7D5|nr:hypothetical protein [Lentzea sp. NBC_00516]WUD25864.1 hypothetical protein OG205_02340 [Lentzea sp. NBC_00516]